MKRHHWAIVGGGIHGVHIAARLVAEGGYAPDDIAIIDPNAALLGRWRRCTAATGMTHLRSPAVHHLDRDPSALTAFAGPKRRRPRGAFAAPYNRPSLSLFNTHCDHVVQTYRLEGCHVRASLERAQREGEDTALLLSDGSTHTAANVVLAMGAGDRLSRCGPQRHPHVDHIFDAGFDATALDRPPQQSVLVVGGGITAVQVALRAHAAGHDVEIVAPHRPRVHQFDSDPGWLGPKYMAGFSNEGCMTRRRALIADARRPGSLPPDVQRSLSRALNTKRCRWTEGRVDDVVAPGQSITVRLHDERTRQPDRVVFATGFAAGRPGGALVDALVRDEGLPCAACGFPLVDTALQWRPGLFTSGPLAELELGPSSRNIAGARRAADRLLDHLRRGRPSPRARRALA